MRDPKLMVCAVVIGAAMMGCGTPATDAEVNDMCKNLVSLREGGPVAGEAELIAKVEDDFAKSEKRLLEWKARDLKGWDEELAAKLEKAESDEDKKALEEEYAKKKKVTEEQFAPDIAKLVPDKKAALEEAKKKAAEKQAQRDEKVAECVKEAAAEGVTQQLAQCRIKAESTDAYWNKCR